MEENLLENMRDIEEYDSHYVVQTSTDEYGGLYVVDDSIFEGKVLDGVLDCATRFETIEEAQSFLNEMKKYQIKGVIKKAKLFVAVEQ
ncbi:hypothetical protein [Exiguobacterium oxidotolerans]|uniref:hypothetical protein n=1 Tax=Exiguobacterium oxidotolerans TaxID=223958 RepID=UPI0004946C30|nr:hypothetical protein [Exiguobacterium oxidotolerans]